MHCRRREMRNREAPIRDYVTSVKATCLKHGVSFILNGGVENYKQFVELQKQYGEDCGVMIAEAAETNATCFSEDGPKSWYVVAKEFIRWCVKFNQHPANAKYCLARIIPNTNGKNKIYALISKSKTLDQMKTILLDQMDDDGNFIENKSEQADGGKSDAGTKVEMENDKKRKVEHVDEPKDLAVSSSVDKKIKV
ncbi:unnamed protein product [Ambrosiozyma monospora]|uniref:Unnamed protein product n=1 Tax=Ambrosiozyma monospora TaxID=43982 RepID=A0A9W6W8P6_AMBMO|nr:unnamed protein product [Ambrosiozyma monospora]